MFKKIMQIDNFSEYLTTIEMPEKEDDTKTYFRQWIQKQLFSGLKWKKRFALFPTKTSSGKRIWLNHYFFTELLLLHANCVILSKEEYIQCKLQGRLSL